MTTQNRRLESTRTSRTERLSIRQAQISDQGEIARMCAVLWTETSIEEHRQEVGRLPYLRGVRHSAGNNSYLLSRERKAQRFSSGRIAFTRRRLRSVTTRWLHRRLVCL